MGKIHGKLNIILMSHKFNKLVLVDSINLYSIAILVIKNLVLFPNMFKKMKYVD
jgi:hypothetical protein